jgi:Zn-dependent M28 family amino/carboxypeptidase
LVAPSFEGSMDNASGIAMMLDIARHYGAVPQARAAVRSVHDSAHHKEIAAPRDAIARKTIL